MAGHRQMEKSVNPRRKSTGKLLLSPFPQKKLTKSFQFGSEIGQKCGWRDDAREQQMLARPRTGDVEQPALGFVDVVEFRLVGGIGDALV